MSDQEAPPRFPEADAIAPAVPVADSGSPDGAASNGAAARPELLIGATFIGGFLTARILKRLASG